MQKLTSDTLFDEDEAEAQWPARRNQIAQNQAEKRKQNVIQTQVPQGQKNDSSIQPAKSTETETPRATDSPNATEDEEDTDLLGEMFSAVPDPSPALEATSNGADPVHTAIRDFGKASGMSPRKVLDEFVRSRYVRLTIVFLVLVWNMD